jgi:alkyl sulfatase BDS1-like metallo-beta-lactamase superfamily hydrolase
MGSFVRGLGLGIIVSAILLGGGVYLFRGGLPLFLGAPTDIITETGHEMLLNGVTFRMQLTPRPSAPA